MGIRFGGGAIPRRIGLSGWRSTGNALRGSRVSSGPSELEDEEKDEDEDEDWRSSRAFKIPPESDIISMDRNGRCRCDV
jgi:hypothetical protein